MTTNDLNRITKLTDMLATANNGALRMDCLSPTAVRLFTKHQAQMEEMGVAVFTDTRIYTPAGYAAAQAQSARVVAQIQADAKAARAAADQRNELNKRADYALDAMLARAERMTMTA